MAHRTLQNEKMRISYREGIVEGERIFENHCHTRYEMIAVFEGNISIVADGARYTLSAGEIIVIPPLLYHSVFAGDITYKRATLLFDEACVPKEIEEDFLGKVKTCPVSSNAALLPILSSIKDIFAEEEIEKYTPLVECHLTEAIYVHTYKESSGAKVKANPTVKALTEYIDSHINEKLLLDDVAESLFLSKSTVSHIFKSEMKISVKQYIIQKKLAYAARIISEGTPAAEAARLIGYDNYANFYKMFKKVIGESPRAKKGTARI